jgi:iron(III) transport system substrate-binding protein
MTTIDRSGRREYGRRAAAAALAAACWLVAGLSFAQKVPLAVYTSFSEAQTRAYKEGFEKANPDVDIRWTLLSSVALTARIATERAAPKADMVVGIATTELLPLDSDNLLLAYAPTNLMAIGARYRDPRHPPTYWWGVGLWGAVVCFNPAEAAKLKLPKPAAWRDLTKPIYKGKVVMPNPQTSAVGSFIVSGWLKMYGKVPGWKFMDGLNENVTGYTLSPETPCQRVASGEIPVGISFDGAAQKLKAGGAAIDIVVPAGDILWDLWSVAILKSTTHVEPAQRFADWLSGKDAMEITARYYPTITVPPATPPAGPGLLPADFEKRLLKYDFLAAGQGHAEMIAEWKKHYAAKVEAK